MKPFLINNKVNSFPDIKNSVKSIIGYYSSILPSGKNAKILLKPNLNANMNALTGNTTDLRIISALIECLKNMGYSSITIGEGTNSGYYRNNISVISRLKVDKLAEYYGVKVTDLNYSEPAYINFENGVKAAVAKDVMEADFLINLPKLKTHFEAGMSVCLKNMMGCLVGQENKKKTHKSLAMNILNINKFIKPHLHIVDGVIAMEGLGPTRGVPKYTGFIIAGLDPVLIDLACAKIAMFDYRKVATLRAAENSGLLTNKHHGAVNSFDVKQYQKSFLPPKAGLLASFIHSPKRQKYFLAVRNTRIFNYLCSTEFIGKILFKSGLRQDNFIKDEMVFEGLVLNKKLCREECSKCNDYCPVGLKLPEEINNNKCIGCLYCFLVCPALAIEFRGTFGFMAEQMRQYDKIVRKIS
ncbi:MAG: DUF362 domain-containing protein [Nitrospirae bacterium]|nr:DUF362 domain-containing protein [Nitrospirota bacterium]